MIMKSSLYFKLDAAIVLENVSYLSTEWIPISELKMATSYQIGFVVNGKLQSSVLAATRSCKHFWKYD